MSNHSIEVHKVIFSLYWQDQPSTCAGHKKLSILSIQNSTSITVSRVINYTFINKVEQEDSYKNPNQLVLIISTWESSVYINW